MTLLKLLGVLVILSVGGVSALGAVRYEKRRVRVLDGWLDMIRHIRTQIDCFLTPLQDILDGFLPAQIPSDLSALLSSSAIYLDTDTKRLLEGFIREIGGGYREDQLRHCDFCIAELRRKREHCAVELPMRQRLAVTLCFTLCVGTAILLW